MSTIVTRAGKGSALTWTEGDANITNLNNDKIEDIVEDLTPQLGGDLDVNGKVITSASNGDITITPNGTGAVVIDGNEFPQTQGVAGQILVADGAGLLEWANQEKLTAKVINADSVTINKGEPVYVFSAQGDLISVKRALNTGDSTSAQTLGLAAGSIAASAEGVVICQGVLTNVDTSTYTAGQGLYLGSTAGSKTTTKPYAPNHLVYLGFVEKVNASSGRIYVRVQNGYELDEIHDVQITTTPSDGQVLAYEAATSLWKPATVSGGGGLANIVEDTTPQLGGDLDVQANIITTSVANGNITITPDGTGDVILSTDTVQIGESTTQGKLTTSGGSIQISTNNGTTTGTINITAGANGNITLIPNGTGKSVMNALNYNEGAIYDLGTTGGTIVPIITNGNVQKITLNSALTINGFSGPVAGQSLTLIIYGGTAYTSITSTMKFAGGVKTLTATAGCIDILTVYYDGTTYFASLGKGYA